MATIIDLRSDTVTRPSVEMRAAMAAAEVGDDVYGEDPTVNLLEQRAAERFGREAALFVPTGTMGNQIAIRLHTQPGQEVIAGVLVFIGWRDLKTPTRTTPEAGGTGSAFPIQHDVTQPPPAPKQQSLLHTPKVTTRQDVSLKVIETSALEILDFNSANSFIIINNSSKPVFAIGFKAAIKSTTSPGEESVSYPLNSELEPHKPHTFKTDLAGTFETIPPQGNNWADHWRIAEKSYKACIRVAFLSPSSMALGQVTDHYQVAGTPLPIGEAQGVIRYKDDLSQVIKEVRVPLKAILLKQQGCQSTQP